MVQYSRSPKTTRRIHQGRKTSSTFRISTAMGTNGTVSQHPDCRTPRKGQYPHPHHPTLLVARDEYMGRKLCCWVCTLPTEQNMYYQEENTAVPHPGGPLHMTVQCHCPRPHHTVTKSKQAQCHTHDHGARIIQSCHLYSLQYDNHQRRGSPPLPQASLSVVWSAIEGHLQ